MADNNVVVPEIINDRLIELIELTYQSIGRDSQLFSKLYIFCYIKDNSYFFNSFFENNGKVYFLKDLEGFYINNTSVNDEYVDNFLFRGIDILKSLKNAFISEAKEVPVVVKIVFDTVSTSMNSSFIYPDSIELKNDLEDYEHFINWAESVSAK